MHHMFNYIKKEHEDSIKEQIEGFIEYNIDANISNGNNHNISALDILKLFKGIFVAV